MAKQRQIRIEQRSALAAIEQLQTRSDEELESETRYRAAAQAILGARAAERYDGKRAREHFQRALAAARPQERLQLKRMADASLALADRRAGDLKQAVEKLGHEAPSGRQLFALRVMGLMAPPAGAGLVARIRGVLLIILLLVALIAAGLGVVELVALPFGGIAFGGAIVLGVIVMAAALGILAAIGRRRQARARAGA